jgi:hypothetical protein
VEGRNGGEAGRTGPGRANHTLDGCPSIHLPGKPWTIHQVLQVSKNKSLLIQVVKQCLKLSNKVLCANGDVVTTAEAGYRYRPNIGIPKYCHTLHYFKEREEEKMKNMKLLRKVKE